ncbi:hypothetical protein I79_007530 [Cricetulus griseus]|uniref:Uncharacterized protein n=1 Tax=Cricetulus griseus TaxID=10029 RepID=G3HAS2_CRIGR|nr:hypothetical protein I79_007530 [Cricetulus griseus]
MMNTGTGLDHLQFDPKTENEEKKRCRNDALKPLWKGIFLNYVSSYFIKSTKFGRKKTDFLFFFIFSLMTQK